MSDAGKFTVIDDEDTEKWTQWSEEFAEREFTDEELDRMLSTWRPLPHHATEATGQT